MVKVALEGAVSTGAGGSIGEILTERGSHGWGIHRGPKLLRFSKSFLLFQLLYVDIPEEAPVAIWIIGLLPMSTLPMLLEVEAGRALQRSGGDEGVEEATIVPRGLEPHQ